MTCEPDKTFFLGSVDIDIMAGVMANEGRGLAPDQIVPKFKTRDDLKHLIQTLHFPRLNADEIADFYLKRQTNRNSSSALKWAYYDFFGDIYIACPTYEFAKHFAQFSPKKNVFFYKWTYIPSYNTHKAMGVPHGAENTYVFGGPVLKNASDKQFSKDVMKMWTNFAKYGYISELHTVTNLRGIRGILVRGIREGIDFI